MIKLTSLSDDYADDDYDNVCVCVLSCPSVAWDDMVFCGLRIEVRGMFLTCGYFPPPEADVLVLGGAQQT